MANVRRLAIRHSVSGTLVFSHRAKKLLASSSLPPSRLRSSLHAPLTAMSDRKSVPIRPVALEELP
jgi:hypothetical protein